MCGAPRRDSHSAFLDGYTAPPSPSSSFPLHPLTHGFITTVNNGCSHTNPTTTTTKQKDEKRQKIIYIFFYFWVPRNQLGFKLAGSVVAHKYGSRMERENHPTTDLLQMSTNKRIFWVFFLKKRIPTSWCNFSLSHPFKAIPCAKRQHRLNAPLPSIPRLSHLCLTAAVIQLQLFVQ